MTEINFTTTKEDTEIIMKIVQRAATFIPDIDRLSLLMGISATHANDGSLKLEELLAAPNFDFTHDITGIANHINRQIGGLLFTALREVGGKMWRTN